MDRSDMNEWLEEIAIKKIDYENGMNRKATVCYMGKITLRMLREYNNLLLGNMQNNYTTILGLKIIEVVEDIYLEVG